MTDKEIILASASPRRREILSELGVKFSVITADTDESSDEREPAALAEQLASKKGLAVYELLRSRGEADGKVIISADTVVVCGTEILGKPKNTADAQRMLGMLRGSAHRVITGVGVTVGGVCFTASSETEVRVADIPDAEILRYIETGDPMDKAGAYGIQGRFSRWICGIDGCYFGVVGLPVNVLADLYLSVTGEELI